MVLSFIDRYLRLRVEGEEGHRLGAGVGEGCRLGEGAEEGCRLEEGVEEEYTEEEQADPIRCNIEISI
jgi:hypothetical protein